MQGKVERIYVAPQGGVEMQKVSQVKPLAGCCLEGDRYCS